MRAGLGAGLVADRVGALNRSALAWALGRGLRFAVGTCVVALLLATTLSGSAAERFATTAYLAAIVAAVALAAGRFLPPPPDASESRSRPIFPAFLGYSIGIVIALSVVAALVSQPGAEVMALIIAMLLILIAVVMRSGAVGAFSQALASGGTLSAARRYVILGAVALLAIAALAGSDVAEGVVVFAYRLAIVATLLFAASLLAPTRAGIFIERSYRRLVAWFDELAHALVFERTATYAAIAAIAAIIPASLLPAPFSEPFAATAWAAAAVAAFGVALECRRLRS